MSVTPARMLKLLRVLVMVAIMAAIGWSRLGTGAEVAGDRIQFNRDIRQILSENCFQCHGPDANKRKAELRLDLEAEVLKNHDGRHAVVRGKVKESELYRRIMTDDGDDLMPPAKSGLKLNAKEKELIARWIEQGAQWQGHWSFVPPARSALPNARQTDWARNPIDNFVVERLSREGLRPSTEADKPTLIRRVTLDLTGLPPTPDEVSAFLQDTAADAYGKVVDRLLRSPHFGERMALPWLDAARYADTHGYQKDNERTMWAWRDWVVNAFNTNMPFDQFTVEQLAGDLLPQPTLTQKLATGFNRNHRINAEAGAIAEEARTEYVADRAETTATVWLGLTVACARCHDHKFDPITQKDYYRLFAFFNSVEENGVDGVGPSPVPQLTVPVPGYEKDIARAEAHLKELNERWQAQALGLQDEQTKWENELHAKLRDTAASRIWSLVEPARIASAEGMKFERLEDLSILGSGPNPLNDDHTVTIDFSEGTVTALRLEALTHESHERGSLARSFDGNFVLSGFEVELVRPGVPPQRLKIRSAEADYSQPGWPVTAAIDVSKDKGWAVDGGQRRENRQALFVLEQPVSGAVGSQLLVRLRYQSKEEQSIIGRFRLATTADAAPSLQASEALPASVMAALKIDRTARPVSQQEIIDRHFRQTNLSLAAIRNEVVAARKELSAFQKRATTTVMIMHEQAQPRDSYVLNRGQYDRPGDKVSPGVPASLPQLKSGASPNRLDLARWLVSPENPLTARVAVNRYWQMYFGIGLVKTTEDFGTQGEPPSHPDLLDWLATEFVRTGWDVKAMQRLIVTSATYRQESKMNAAMFERDPENRLLARGPRFRLPAQLLRDQALAVSGLLVPRIGGPPVKPYQPAGLWSATAGINSNTTKYEPDTGEGLYRRSLYSFWKRAVPPPAMMVFDAADREVCSVKRRLTNTPLQALNLLNDVTYVEASRVLAERVLAIPALADDARIRDLWRRVVAREPSSAELSQLTNALNAYQQKFQQSPRAAAELLHVGATPANPQFNPTIVAAWSTLAALVLNCDETVTKE